MTSLPSPAIQSVRLVADCRRECVPIRSRVVDIGVVQIAVGLHLRLHGLNHFAFAEDLMVHLDAGDFLEGLGQHRRFIGVGRNAFREHVDFHALERLRRLDEPFHLLHLVFLGESRWLEFAVDPFLRGCHVGIARTGKGHERHGRGRRPEAAISSIILPVDTGTLLEPGLLSNEKKRRSIVKSESKEH